MNQSLSLITNKHNENINKLLNAFESYLSTINTGRVTPKLIDNIYIKLNSSKVKIIHIAAIKVLKNIIIINPWDIKNLKFIEKSILESNLKFFPNSNGKQITITVPPLTRIDRENIFKDLKKKGRRIKSINKAN